MKTTVIVKTSHEKLDVKQIASDSRWKTNSRRCSAMHRKRVGTIRKQLFAFVSVKNSHTRFNGIQWTANGNWTVRCAVLMGLLAKNTVKNYVNLQRQKARKTVTFMSLQV